jgi:hypothetical protein
MRFSFILLKAGWDLGRIRKTTDFTLPTTDKQGSLGTEF